MPAIRMPNSATSAVGGRVPAIFPSSMMAMRSQIERSSSSSLEIIHDRRAVFPVVLAQRVEHQFLGANVDAAGRLGDEEQVGFHGEGFGQADLLLVAARQLLGLLPGAGALDVEQFDVFFAERFHALVVALGEDASQDGLQVLAVDLHGGEGDVPIEALVEKEAHAAAILGHEGHARLERLGRRVERDVFAVKRDFAARGGRGP